MPYINVGAFIDNRRAPSKAALKAALKAEPASVYFDQTSAFGPSGDLFVTDLQPGVSYSVVGPDPYTSRKFYATVTVTTDGKVKIS